MLPESVRRHGGPGGPGMPRGPGKRSQQVSPFIMDDV